MTSNSSKRLLERREHEQTDTPVCRTFYVGVMDFEHAMSPRAIGKRAAGRIGLMAGMPRHLLGMIKAMIKTARRHQTRLKVARSRQVVKSLVRWARRHAKWRRPINLG